MYAKPLDIWDALDMVDDRAEDFGSVSSGDEIELEEKYLVSDAFTVNGDEQDIVVKQGGTVVSTSDYGVDLRDGTVTWNGSGGVDLKIRYKTAPIPNSSTVSALESATERVDNMTNTTYDGTENVTETYDVERPRQREFILFNRPVDEINQVRVNKARMGDSDDFETLTKGRSEDYIEMPDLGIKFSRSAAPREGSAILEVDYNYGYNNIPEPIKELTKMLASQQIMNETIVGELVNGREDFNPTITQDFNSEKDKIVDNWTVTRFNEQVPVKEG